MIDESVFEQIALEEVTCCSCATRYGMTKALLDLRKKDYASFYCPNGHPQSYVRPPKNRDEELEEAREQTEQMRAEVEEARNAVAVAHAEVEQIRSARRPLIGLGSGR